MQGGHFICQQPTRKAYEEAPAPHPANTSSTSELAHRQTHTELGECLSCKRKSYPSVYSDLCFTTAHLELHVTLQNQPRSVGRPPLGLNCQTYKCWPPHRGFVPRAQEKMEMNLIYSVGVLCLERWIVIWVTVFVVTVFIHPGSEKGPPRTSRVLNISIHSCR